MKKLSFIFAIIFVFAMLVGCAGETDPKIPPEYGDKITPTDYSDPNHWLNIPKTDFEVDVFYLYPTSWSRVSEDEPYYCEIDNPTMLAGAVGAYNGQATAYETEANVYAPFYRQIDASWLLQSSLQEGEKYFEGMPYTDAVAAFEYYIENFNNGKPFILAGHSQGSSVIKALLKYYMAEHPEVYERMVAAYVIGYYITEDELAKYSHLKFAQGPDDTGVIISWNVEAPDLETENPLAPDGIGAISINPILWTLEETPATKEQNLGSEIFSRADNSITHADNLADATVNKERGTVICSTVDIDSYGGGVGLFPRGVYHLQDYGFYYHNIRENTGVRIDAYLNK